MTCIRSIIHNGILKPSADASVIDVSVLVEYRFVVLRSLIPPSTSRLQRKPPRSATATAAAAAADLSCSVTFPHNRYIVVCDICKHLIILCGYSFNGFDHKVKPAIQAAGKAPDGVR